MPPASETAADVPRRLSVCLINPRFKPSYWGMDHVLPLMAGDKRNWTVTGALPALAALAPEHCDVVLLDENVEAIDFGRLGHFDVIGVTGMITQHDRMFEILKRLQGLPGKIAVGGPYVSVAENRFSGLCDVRFIGEAEETWPAFLNALARGLPVEARYEQGEKTNMETVPPPRYDLLKSEHYMLATLQFSRGCPFLCEFCDIITIFGRRPRLKSPEQMIVEFEAIRRAGFRNCFLVDDNFIGNKQKAKEMLRLLIDWQATHGYPLSLSTEASINLADDAELLDLMLRANFRQVFIGIETPRASSLAETKKIQNIRGDTILDKLQRIRDAGLVIQAGFIVGFDNDDERIFDEQYDFIQASGIAQAMVAILTPVPTTPLYARLEAEGRLDFSHPDVIFHPRQMSRETLKAGYDDLMRRLYEPEAYFTRLLDGYEGAPAFRASRARLEELIGRRRTLLGKAVEIAGGLGLALRLVRDMIRKRQLRVGLAYWRQWRRNRRMPGKIAIPFAGFMRVCADHWHYYIISTREQGRFGAVSGVDASPEPRPAAA